MRKRYSVIGLGKLGASMAAAIASRGFEVIGVDVSEKVVAMVKAGRAPVQETALEETLSAHRKLISATTSYRDAVANSDISFVIVPTPSDARGAFSLEYAARACREIGRAIRLKQQYHLVVITSTVLPGSTRHGLLPILESESGKVCGRDFGICYSPEFIALGTVIRDFLNPDFTLIGEYDNASGEFLQQCYEDVLLNGAPSRRMSLENAELTKIALNAYVTMKITFANGLADLCERIPGGDVDLVTDALGCDRRIGGKYLTGALGYGGPCFPRDNAALCFLARALGTKVELSETTDRLNRGLASQAVERLKHILGEEETVAVLGLSYKPGSHVVEEAQGIHLIRSLYRAGINVVGYDPLANAHARRELGDQIRIFDSLKQCLAEASVVVLTTPDREFQRLKTDDFLCGRDSVTVVDFWRILDRELAQQPKINYVPFGRNRDQASAIMALEELWGAVTMAALGD